MRSASVGSAEHEGSAKFGSRTVAHDSGRAVHVKRMLTKHPDVEGRAERSAFRIPLPSPTNHRDCMRPQGLTPDPSLRRTRALKEFPQAKDA